MVYPVILHHDSTVNTIFKSLQSKNEMSRGDLTKLTFSGWNPGLFPERTWSR